MQDQFFKYIPNARKVVYHILRYMLEERLKEVLPSVEWAVLPQRAFWLVIEDYADAYNVSLSKALLKVFKINYVDLNRKTIQDDFSLFVAS